MWRELANDARGGLKARYGASDGGWHFFMFRLEGERTRLKMDGPANRGRALWKGGQKEFDSLCILTVKP